MAKKKKKSQSHGSNFGRVAGPVGVPHSVYPKYFHIRSPAFWLFRRCEPSNIHASPVSVSYEWMSIFFVFFFWSSSAISIAAAATRSLLSQLKESRPAPQVTRFPQVTSKSWSLLHARLASFRITAEKRIPSFVSRSRFWVFFSSWSLRPPTVWQVLLQWRIKKNRFEGRKKKPRQMSADSKLKDIQKTRFPPFQSDEIKANSWNEQIT